LGNKIKGGGLVILLMAMAFYLAGNTLWLGFAIVGILVEIVGWVVVLSEKRD
jgi:hypothetical protein